MNRWQRTAAVFLAALLAGGCALLPADGGGKSAAAPTGYWNMKSLAGAAEPRVRLEVADPAMPGGRRTVATVDRGRVHLWHTVFERMRVSVGLESVWLVVKTGEEPMAMAARSGQGVAGVVVSVGTLAALGDDADAIAVLLGQPLDRIARGGEAAAAPPPAASGASALFLGGFVPFASGATEEQERTPGTLGPTEAGRRRAQEAGFDPAGATRLAARLRVMR